MRMKKEGEFINAKIERGLADRLNRYAAETGLSKTAVIEKALRAYLDGGGSGQVWDGSRKE